MLDVRPDNNALTHLSFVHFGDLHVREEADENYEDLLNLIDEANHHLKSRVDSRFCPEVTRMTAQKTNTRW